MANEYRRILVNGLKLIRPSGVGGPVGSAINDVDLATCPYLARFVPANQNVEDDGSLVGSIWVDGFEAAANRDLGNPIARVGNACYRVTTLAPSCKQACAGGATVVDEWGPDTGMCDPPPCPGDCITVVVSGVPSGCRQSNGISSGGGHIRLPDVNGTYDLPRAGTGYAPAVLYAGYRFESYTAADTSCAGAATLGPPTDIVLSVSGGHGINPMYTGTNYGGNLCPDAAPFSASSENDTSYPPANGLGSFAVSKCETGI